MRHHFFSAVFPLALVLLAAGCTSTSTVERISERQSSERLLERFDSLISKRLVVSQDCTWRESVLRQLQSIRERSDTTRMQVVDSAGNVIRERVIINNVRETTSETDRREREVMQHRLEQMDSTVNAMSVKLSRTDSLLRSRQQVAERQVPARLSWHQQLRLWLGNILLVALAVLAAVWLMRKHVFPFIKQPDKEQ